MATLFINCCPREESRTVRLAKVLLEKLGAYEEVNLYATDLAPLDEARLQKRTALLQRGEFDAPEFALARRFASADRIVIAAPFWDLSFPSKLKLYLENIYAVGIVSRYDENGKAEGLCRAEKLYYVTTAGGQYDPRYGYEYLKTLCQTYFGIPEVKLLKAEMLDVQGNNPEQILQTAMKNVIV